MNCLGERRSQSIQDGKTSYMFEQSSTDSMTTSKEELNDPECANKPIIKILLYTDAATGITNGEEQFGLGPMIRHLLSHKPVFADVCVEWVSRFSSETGAAKNKLDLLLTD